MVAFLSEDRLKTAAPVVSFGAGALVALGIAILPDWRLAGLGLEAFSASLAPPFGVTARSLLALAGGAGTAGLLYGASLLTLRFMARPAPIAGDVPVLRRADAHPDAPARRPLHASEDLGQPLPMGSVPPPPGPVFPIIEKTLPVNLETPLAAIDPGSIPDVPREPVRAVASLAPAPAVREVAPVAEAVAPSRPTLIAPGERFETFALTPIRRRAEAKPAPPPQARSETPRVDPANTSINALLDRLERGAARREARPRPSLEETLGILRGLAAQ